MERCDQKPCWELASRRCGLIRYSISFSSTFEARHTMFEENKDYCMFQDGRNGCLLKGQVVEGAEVLYSEETYMF